MGTYQQLLVAVDLSEDSRLLVAKGKELAGAFGARVTILHVIEYIPMDIYGDIMLPMDQGMEEQMLEHAKKRLQELRESSCKEAETHIAHGSTKTEIINTALDLNADLIVVGRHGRHGVSRLLGSTANAVLHHAPCDVLAVNIGVES